MQLFRGERETSRRKSPRSIFGEFRGRIIQCVSRYNRIKAGEKKNNRILLFNNSLNFVSTFYMRTCLLPFQPSFCLSSPTTFRSIFSSKFLGGSFVPQGQT
ncbi:uncharacterized protein LOC118449456 [Vespa mandarinia]|uniref:uncharacterized protein LOC118449456 n=1 Tax=Vespa mandarinia TaxID=7446 RepID=UPI001616B808|nr:uncharacterized protein LOC118449456 [Vespa mandarinia]